MIIMNDYELIKFWSNREVRRYSRENTSFSLHELKHEPIQDLIEIGIPRIKLDYYNFFPVRNLKIRTINGEAYITLGSFFRENNMEDNVVVLNVNDGSISFDSKPFYEAGLAASEVSIINNSFKSFLNYEMEFVKFIESVFFSKEKPVFDDVKLKMNHLVENLNRIDGTGMQKMESCYQFWRKKIYDLSFDIEEQYEKFLPNYFDSH